MYESLKSAWDQEIEEGVREQLEKIEQIDDHAAEILGAAKTGKFGFPAEDHVLDIRKRSGLIAHQQTMAYKVLKGIDMIGYSPLYILPNGMYALGRKYDISLRHRSHLIVVELKFLPGYYIDSFPLKKALND